MRPRTTHLLIRGRTQKVGSLEKWNFSALFALTTRRALQFDRNALLSEGKTNPDAIAESYRSREEWARPGVNCKLKLINILGAEVSEVWRTRTVWIWKMAIIFKLPLYALYLNRISVFTLCRKLKQPSFQFLIKAQRQISRSLFPESCSVSAILLIFLAWSL